jgi:Na+-driven multidrug efflux pump
VLTGALQGAGDTKAPMWFTIITNWLIRIPLAYVLAIIFKLGPSGVWWAMLSSIVIQGMLVGWRYQSRAWLRLKI